MNQFDHSYQTLLRQIADNGSWTVNRTGVDTCFIPAGMIQFDLRKGFPLTTLRTLPNPKAGVAEAIGFLRGYQNASEFEAIGCNFWRQNADETPQWLQSSYRKGAGDLGRIYGMQWRDYPPALPGQPSIDQIAQLVHAVIHQPTSRRHVVTAWHPGVVLNDMAALPPCHDSFTVTVDRHNELMHLSWRQRSTDIVLGTPANAICYAFILMLLARLTGYTPGIVTGHLDNVHYYEPHRHGVETLLTREILPPAKVVLADNIECDPTSVTEVMDVIDNMVSPQDVLITDYQAHPVIRGLRMVV